MILPELIHYFRTNGNKEEFFKIHSLNSESEVIEIYMQKPFNSNNKIEFFEIEQTEGKIEFIINNIKYYNIIDFYYFFDFITESQSLEQKTTTDEELAQILLSYSINDA